MPWLLEDQGGGGSGLTAGGADIHYAAVRDLTLMHLFELHAVRLFGPARLEDELRQLRRMLQ